MGEILIIKLSALGDLVQADGAIRDIRNFHPEDRLTLMTTPAYRGYMERCPWVDEIFIDPRASRLHLPEMLALRKRLKQKRFDRVYDLQQVGRTRFYYRYLFPRTWWLGDAPGCNLFLKRPDDICAADHFHNHLHRAGIPTTHTLQCDVSWMADEVDELLSQNRVEPGFVMLIPGASAVHDAKRWPGFGQLAERLIEYGRQPVTVPGPAEMDQCRSMPGTMLVSENGYLDYFALAGVARRAAFVIGNDTGPTHIAAHLGCRGLALYGGHTPAQTTGIQHTRFSWLESENMADLTLERVWAKARSAIGEDYE
ncbi:MAG: glycosyltransferase family 9 protein [Desulfocapsaceae bacterium]